MEPEKNLNSQNNPEQKEYWRDFYPILKVILQRYSNKSNMLLAQNIPVDKQNKREHPNMNTQNYSHLIFDKETQTKNELEKRQYLFSVLECDTGKTEFHIQKNEIRYISITLHKNYMQSDKRSQFETRNMKTSRRNGTQAVPYKIQMQEKTF